MRKVTFIILVFLFAASLFSFIPQGVQAQPEICPEGFRGGLVPCGRDCNVPPPPGEIDLIDESQPCQICHFFVMTDKILDFIFFTLIPAVAVLMLAIGGIMFFFAGGSPQRLEKAKSIITSTIMGLVIIFAAWVIINTFFVIIGVADTDFGRGVMDWFTIDCEVD